MSRKITKEELTEALYDIFQLHRSTKKYGNNDSKFIEHLDTADGMPFVLNATMSLGVPMALSALARPFLSGGDVDKEISEVAKKGIDKLTSSDQKKFAISIDDDGAVEVPSAKEKVTSPDRHEPTFRERLIKTSTENPHKETPLTPNEMFAKMEAVDLMCVSMTDSIINDYAPNAFVMSKKPEQNKISDFNDDRTPASNDEPTVKSNKDAVKFGVYHEVPTYDGMGNTNENHNQMIDTGAAIVVALAITYVGVVTVLKKTPNTGKPLQRERNIDELAPEITYQDTLTDHIGKMRKLTSKDEWTKYISDNMFEGVELKNFDNILSFVANLPENKIKTSIE